MKRAILIAFATVALVACGSEDDDNGTKVTTKTDAGIKTDAGTTQTDAGTQQQTDAGTQQPDAGTQPSSCLAESDFGAVTDYDYTEGYYDTMDGDKVVMGYFDLNDDPDTLTVELYEGLGVFTDGLKTGTFQITGDELNYETCGLCVSIGADYYDDNPQTYLATGGTVTLTSVDGHLTGTLSNVTFEHVTIDDETSASTPVNDGCTSKISSASFDTTLEQAQQ